MDQNGSAGTAMLGLAGFVLLAVSELGGEVEQAVETTERVVGCPGCGVLARLHNRRPVRVCDLPAAGQVVTLIWVKRVRRCVEPACTVQTWTEHAEGIRPRASLTERARREACRRVGQDGHTVAQVAGQLAVGWATVMAAVREYGYPLVDDPARLEHVSVLGVDETAFQGAGPHRSTTFVTGIVDLSGPSARLLDVVPGRVRNSPFPVGESTPTGLARRDHRGGTGSVRGYATALRTTLPAATRVLDCFHVTPPGLRSCRRRPPSSAERDPRAPRPTR